MPIEVMEMIKDEAEVRVITRRASRAARPITATVAAVASKEGKAIADKIDLMIENDLIWGLKTERADGIK
jgi:hypothetical protein